MAFDVRLRFAVRLAFAGWCLAGAPLSAGDGEDWKDYVLQEAGLTIRFPAEPAVSQTSYSAIAADGGEHQVPATVHTVDQGETRYSVTIAHLAGTPAEHPHALKSALDGLRRTGLVQLETPVSMANSSCGYYLGLAEADGALSFLALFYNSRTANLIDVRARVPEAEQQLRMAGAVQFQQSLSFLAEPDANAAATELAYPDIWREYEFLAASGFAIRFPAAPTVAGGSYRTAAGVTVPAVRYEAVDGAVRYTVTAATFWETPADTGDSAEAIEPAIGLLSEGGRIVSDFSVGLRNGQCGRELTVENADGSRSDVTLFYPSSQHRLFIIEARHPAALAPVGTDWFRGSFRLAAPRE